VEILQKVFISINQKEKKYGKISQTLEGLCFVISVSDHSRPNAGKDGNDKLHLSHAFILKYVLYF
jgi:hypothetical protein